jgi:uncharacterized protein DUF4326
MAAPSIPQALPFDQSDTITIPIGEVVFDPTIYPRSELDHPTVGRYREAYMAGEPLPPIVLETGTNRLLDGRHRWISRCEAEYSDVEAVYHAIPPGVDAQLYCAELSVRNGLPVSDLNLKAIARRIYSSGTDETIVEVARRLGRHRATVEAWVYDIRQERRNEEARDLKVRQMMVMLLRDPQINWTQQRIADLFRIVQSGVAAIIYQAKSNMIDNLDESVLRAAIARLPKEVLIAAEEIAERWREERLFSHWSDEERALLVRLRAEETVVLNMRENGQPNLWRWAEQAGLAIRIDRASDWGNPFLLNADGDRDECCDHYEQQYWPYKPSLQSRISTLRGKALGCWCHPFRCHGDFLKREAEQ